MNAPIPENPQQLRSFLGLLNYHGKFISNLASLVNPLNKLLHKDATWQWDATCQMAFQSAKEALTSSPVLMHYDPALHVNLATDASAYGVGAVISHTLPDGTERPIAFASRTLTSSESHYAQIEKEALSIVFGVKCFHTYLYGRQFTLLTDHKPLCTILVPRREYLRLLLLAFNIGLFLCQHTATTFVTSLPKSMPMQTVCHSYHYHITPRKERQ